MKISRFLLYYHLFAAMIAGLALALQSLLAPMHILSPHFWVLFITLYVLTVTAYVLTILGIKNGGGIAIYSIMGGIFVKMMLSLVVIMVLIIKFPETKLITAFNFFCLYFLFTVFEVICLLRNLRDQNKM